MAEIDEGWHKDFHIAHLPAKAQRLAKKIRKYLHKRLPPILDREIEGPKLNNMSSGCRLFESTFSYPISFYPNEKKTRGRGGNITYHDVPVEGLLHLVYDGGSLYDLFSSSGDGMYYGMDEITPLRKLLEPKYEMEETTSYCRTIREAY